MLKSDPKRSLRLLTLPPASLLAGFCALALAGAASALSVTGDAMIIAPPPSAAHMQLESNDGAFVWAEQSGVVVTDPFLVDVIPFQNHPENKYDSGVASVQNQWRGNLPAGTYDSFFFHADKDGPNQTFNGMILLPGPVVGIIYRNPPLVDTDDLFGAIGTEYSGGSSNRNYDLDGANNWFEISDDKMKITFNQVVAHNMDDMRILIASVPEPRIAGMLGIGLAGLLWLGRRPTR